ncbi:sn-glycerol-3-phosphate ABC transporter ATP-binding protein UgpC [Romeria aff. gracilis LEGE 07310]|uniref:sn-glycerol-3-phosphate ABC transporter ATP-binding protein UgpC n=1 Tax=Vasconcelosia minhoensis LEGE 07310 TaxID=915328 RepID=A0A8J7B0F2_9CYAN|nr:sn-glycerol-3-phosphate ABC transporter ATP-binding protein UgpC [Romeria gracilis]MBE9079902.1 sn-glycerol-3-phosphate ABC transporter ATP-binding protein UgpC [Romeria aff. gracilis LEGE 07310]
MARVVFEQVTKQYDNGYVAVKDLNLDIGDQEFVVLVGPSGCGKTTSLRMLAGLEEITSGNLYIGDRQVNQAPAKDRDIAMVFQSYALYPHMSVFENMAFSLELQGVPKAEMRDRVQSAAKQLGIEPLLDRKPKQLSGGQRQRVAVGRAIVRNPAVFLMDEPLSNLDAKLRVQARAELSRLHQKLGTTFIYVTHDQAEAMTMGSRIAVMNQGILQQVDTPQNVYEHPNNVFVAGFLGSPSMNFFDATLQAEDGELKVQAGSLTLPVPEEMRSRYQEYVNRPLILGIRPEGIYTSTYAPSGIQPFPIRAKLSVVELMGHEAIVYCTLPDDTEFIARLDPRAKLTAGDTLDLQLDTSRFHLFDKESEQAI